MSIAFLLLIWLAGRIGLNNQTAAEALMYNLGMSPPSIRRLLASIVVTLTAVASPSLAAARGGQSEEWRQKPQPLRPAKSDTVPPATRAARDDFFDRLLGPPPDGSFSDGPDVGPIFQEIPTEEALTTALVGFADYTTIRSASGKSIYTEVSVNVEQVLRDPSATVRTGMTLTVILGGGSLELPSGQILRKNLDQGAESGIQPGHRYLAFLSHENEGDYFYCAKSWDLSSGVTVPTYPLDIQKAKNGTSRFAGMPEAQFIAAVRGILSSGAR